MNNFYNLNKGRDYYMDTSISVNNDEIPEYSMIKVNSKSPYLIGSGWFVLFTFLTISQFYKYYINSICSSERLEIIKELSTRVDLNAPVYHLKYALDAPKLKFRGITEEFNNYTSTMFSNPAPINEHDLLPSKFN